MAERRMFAKTIIDSDAFLDMPLSTQSLYFHLSMRADDEGFLNNPKKIQRMIGASEDDLKLLIAKKFLIPFESGIVVIKHWYIHNYIQNDRRKETVYVEEKNMLRIKKNKAYTLDDSKMDTLCIQDVSKMDSQDRLGKDRLGKDKGEDKPTPDYQEIIQAYNETCVSFPKLKSLSDARKKAIRARLKQYTIEDFKLLFKKAEASGFLKGGNNRNWSATFDWMIKDANMAKILDGNYDDKSKAGNFMERTYTHEQMDALEKQLLDN